MKPRLILCMVCILLLFPGCNKNEVVKDKVESNNNISGQVIFKSLLIRQQVLPDVSIMVIGNDGEVINELITNNAGETKKKLTVPIDKRYYQKNNNKLDPRGTITAIAFKKGYSPTVLFEVPVSNAGTVQTFYMQPVLEENRSEPITQLGNNHRLEIISLVEKYAPYVKKK